MLHFYSMLKALNKSCLQPILTTSLSRNYSNRRAVVVAQLVKQLLSTPEIRVSNLAIGELYLLLTGQKLY